MKTEDGRSNRTKRPRKDNDKSFNNDESESEDKKITARILFDKSKSSKHFKRNFDYEDQSTESR